MAKPMDKATADKLSYVVAVLLDRTQNNAMVYEVPDIPFDR